MKSFTKNTVAEITGLKPRMVQCYTEQKLVTPGIDNTPGRGRVRRYSELNLLEFLIIKELVGYKMTGQAIQSILWKAIDIGIVGKWWLKNSALNKETGMYISIFKDGTVTHQHGGPEPE